MKKVFWPTDWLPSFTVKIKIYDSGKEIRIALFAGFCFASTNIYYFTSIMCVKSSLSQRYELFQFCTAKILTKSKTNYNKQNSNKKVIPTKLLAEVLWYS